MGAQGDILTPLQMQLALVRGHVPGRHGPLDAIRRGVADDGVDPVGQTTVLHQAQEVHVPVVSVPCGRLLPAFPQHDCPDHA